MVRISLFLTSLFKKRPLVLISIVVLLLLFAIFRIYNAGFGRNLLEYIPEEAVRTKVYLEALRHIGGEENCYIILHGEIPKIVGKIEKITDGLRKIPEINDIQYSANNDLKNFYFRIVKASLPLYLTPESLEKFLYRTTPAGMEEAIRKTQLRLMMPGGGEIGAFDPLGLTDFIKPFPEMERFLDKDSGYYLLEGGRGLILIATASGDPRDLSFDHKLLQGIDDVMKKHLDEKDNITFTVTGSHAITYYEATQMKRDMKWNILSSLLLVGAVILIFVRKLRVMLYAFLPVGISILITLAFCSLFLGPLTEAAGGFGAILIGLGVDLPVVLYVRHVFLRNIEGSVEATARGIWTGVLTTWATFAPMAISHFIGIKEIGVLTSTGIIFCAVVLFGLVAGFMRPGTHTVAPFDLSPIGQMLLRRRARGFIILLLFISVPFSLWTIKNINFSVDLKELGSGNNPARTALGEIIKEGEKVFLIGDTINPEDAIKKADKIESQLRASGIKDIISITTFLPPLEQQLMVIDRLKDINTKDVIKSFVEITEKAGFSKQFIDDYSGDLRAMLSVKTPIRYKDIDNIGFLKDRFLWNDKKGSHYLIVLNNVDTRNILTLDDMTITNRELIKKELTGLLQGDALKITLIGFFLVNLILFLSFRKPIDVLFVQVPILIGILFTGAILILMGRTIHIMSALTGVMLFGIGTDYAIHLVHHLRKEKDIDKVLSQTGSAVIISALTTMCGFGSLYFSSYRGLSDMGLAVAIGTAFNLILVFLFIPLYRAVSAPALIKEN